MNGFLTTLHQRLSALTELIGRSVSWLTLVMTLLMFTLVVLRYAFNFNMILLQESVLYLHAMVFLLGAGYTLKADEHVRVDILYRGMSERNKAKVNLLGCLLLLLPMMVFIGIISWDYVAFSWSMLEKSQDAGGLPFVYLLKSLILGMVFTVSLQGIAEAARSAAILTSPHNSLKNNSDKEAN